MAHIRIIKDCYYWYENQRVGDKVISKYKGKASEKEYLAYQRERAKKNPLVKKALRGKK